MNMAELLFDKKFFEQLNTLKMGLSMRLTQGMSGMRKSTAKGSSVEFSDFREYMLGDDIRRIDWNAYGRTDKLYIKQFMEEKEGVFQIFLDTSASMDFGAQPKSRMALQLAAALSYIILGNLDRVYVSELRESSQVRGKGLTGAAAFPHILQTLERVEFSGGTVLSRAILSREVPLGGAAIIISDFLDADGIEEAMKYLAYRRQTMVLVQVLAPEELTITYEGTVNLHDVETGDRLRVTMSNAAIRQYQHMLKEHQRQLQQLALKYGASCVFVRSDADLAASMLHGFSGVLAAK